MPNLCRLERGAAVCFQGVAAISNRQLSIRKDERRGRKDVPHLTVLSAGPWDARTRSAPSAPNCQRATGPSPGGSCTRPSSGQAGRVAQGGEKRARATLIHFGVFFYCGD